MFRFLRRTWILVFFLLKTHRWWTRLFGAATFRDKADIPRLSEAFSRTVFFHACLQLAPRRLDVDIAGDPKTTRKIAKDWNVASGVCE